MHDTLVIDTLVCSCAGCRCEDVYWAGLEGYYLTGSSKAERGTVRDSTGRVNNDYTIHLTLQNIGTGWQPSKQFRYLLKKIHLYMHFFSRKTTIKTTTTKNCYNHKTCGFLQITIRGKALFYSVVVLWYPPQLSL